MDRLQRSSFCKSYTLGGSDIDFGAENRGPIAFVRLVTSGTLVLVRANGGGTNASTGAAEAIVGAESTKALVSGSTAGIQFEAYWP